MFMPIKYGLHMYATVKYHHDRCTAYFSRLPQACDCSTCASSETGSFCSRKGTALSSPGQAKINHQEEMLD